MAAPIPLKDVLADNALRQAEMRLVGSFIMDPDVQREKQFFTERRIVQSAEQFRDSFAGNVFRAVDIALSQGADATPEKLASILIDNKLIAGVDADKLDDSLRQLTDTLKVHAKVGATTLKEFLRVEAMLDKRNREERGANWMNEAQAIWNKVDNKTYSEKLLEIRKSLDTILGAERVAGETLTIERQLELLEKDLPAEMAALEGKCLPIIPPHFGQLQAKLEFLQPGQMSVFSAPTGAGKSMVLATVAEWNAMAQGIPTALFAFEDDRGVITKRAVSRWTQCTYKELEKGDPRGKMAEYAKLLRKMHDANGGTCRYEVRPGLGGSELVLFLEQMLQKAIEANRPLGLICVDYLQKISFWKDTPLYGSEVLAIQYTVERLRTLAQTYNTHIMIGSQVTREADGNLKIAWSKAAGEKAQIHIQGSRELSPDDLFVYNSYLDDQHKKDPILLVEKGVPLPFMMIKTEKANRGEPAVETLQIMGASQRIVTPDFQLRVAANPEEEWKSIRYQKATSAEIANFEKAIERQNLVTRQVSSLL